MDGTFKITPDPWKQVAIVSVEISEGNWIPIAFGLLPDKKLDSYLTFFNLLKTALASHNFTISATHFMADFEDNIRKVCRY